MIEKACVYTCVIGDYETLNEQVVLSDPDIPHFCFTDNSSLKSDTWQIRYIAPAFPMDNVRSQRRIKILAHEYLPHFDASLYIDNTVLLNMPVSQLIEQLLGDADITIPRHSFRESVYDEFVVVAANGLDEPSRIFEQLNHYQLSYPDVLNERPFWSAILFRRHNQPEVRQVMANWYDHVARYSRRDQLSLNVALRNCKAKIKALDVDNLQSSFHTWPIIQNRKPSIPQHKHYLTGSPTKLEMKLLQIDLESLTQEIRQLKNSRSFRITKPLRWLWNKIF
jgi:hypothetical protein